jgi:hypothetical protein
VSPQMVRCYYGCGREIDANGWTTRQNVTHAWAVKIPVRASGAPGGRDIELCEYGSDFACDSCIRRVKAGLPVGQESLDL